MQVPAGHVYLVTYRLEEYADLAQQLHIWPYPRAHFQNIALLPYRFAPAVWPWCPAFGILGCCGCVSSLFNIASAHRLAKKTCLGRLAAWPLPRS